MRVVSINISSGGVPKTPVESAVIGPLGLEGDGHVYKHHGGPDRAVVLYAREIIDALRVEGHPIAIGSTGENLTVDGLDWARLVPGAEVSVGEVRLQISKYATPCKTIQDSFIGRDISRVSQEAHPGWSRVCARVLQGGTVAVGDPVRLLGFRSGSAFAGER